MVFLQPGVERGEAHAQHPRGGPLVPPMLLQGLLEDLLLRPLEPRLVGGAGSGRPREAHGGERQIVRLDLLAVPLSTNSSTVMVVSSHALRGNAWGRICSTPVRP